MKGRTDDSMTQTLKRIDNAYLEDIRNQASGRGPDWINEIRRRSLDRLEEIGLPHHKLEAWRFTNVEPLTKTHFRHYAPTKDHGLSPKQLQHVLLGAGACGELVFVDGTFAPDLSNLLDVPAGVDIMPLARGITDDSLVVKAHLDQYLKHSDAFSLMNSACLQDGAYVHVRQNVLLERAIHIVYVSTGHRDNQLVQPRSLIVVEESSKAAVVESYVGLNDNVAYFNNAVTECVVQENAQLSLCKIVQESASGHHLGTAQVTQHADSLFAGHTITLDGKIVRNALGVVFNGKGAQCSLNGLYLNTGERLVDNALSVDHAQPYCASRIAYKGVLEGSSKSVFTGGVQVRKHAVKTDSNQINSNLLLSDLAQINTKPQLEIFADDVKCTHGATVGPPPEDLIYYFRTRGIDETEAVAMLTCGFARDITKTIGVPILRERVDTAIARKYSRVKAPKKR